jgi:hypothetical protein
MNRSHCLLILLGLVLLTAAADLAWLYPQLPERMATKFGTGGQPVAWSTRGSFLTVQIFSLGFVAALFLGLWWAMPRLPASLINLPHRHYWLAPEREAATRQWLGDLVLGLGIALVAFLTCMGHLAMRANLAPEPRLGSAFWWVTALYLAGTLGLVVWLYRRFRVPR